MGILLKNLEEVFQLNYKNDLYNRVPKYYNTNVNYLVHKQILEKIYTKACKMSENKFYELIYLETWMTISKFTGVRKYDSNL